MVFLEIEEYFNIKIKTFQNIRVRLIKKFVRHALKA
jgi:hypothetical protein